MAIHPPQIPGLADWRPLARGGFAVVWQARQESLDRLVAVKVDQRRLDVESERLRFLREAGAAGRMSSHPGIVTVHDAGILGDDRPYLVMDLCPGGSLTRYLKPDQRLSQTDVRDIGVRIADALAATHERGVLHRDVKPANLLLDSYGNVGLADFGLAALPGPRTPPSESFQALTPAYTAPEILHRRAPGPTGDVYSLAATLYALLDGRPPRWPEAGTPSLPEVLQLHQRPVGPIEGVAPALMEVLLPALSPDPAARPDAATFRDQLAAVRLPGEPPEPLGAAVAARSGTGSTAAAGPAAAGSAVARRAPGRRRALVLALLASLLVAGLVSALVLLGRDRQPGAAPVPDPAGTTAGPPTATGPSPSGNESATAGPSRSRAVPAPDPVILPDGFDDCSETLGDGAYCPTSPECWAGIISVQDSPAIATARDCDQTHVYQTFVAAALDDDVRLQSRLEADRDVRKRCAQRRLDDVLRPRDRSTDWEILVIPPQADDGRARVYRCIFGAGERRGPTPLTLPR